MKATLFFIQFQLQVYREGSIYRKNRVYGLTCSVWPPGVEKVMGSILSPRRVIAQDVKNFTYCCYVRCATLIVWLVGMPWPQTGVPQYHAQLGLPDKGRAIKGLVLCNNWDLEPLDLLNGLALGCYQQSPDVLIYYY